MTVAFRLTIYQANGTTPDLTLTSLRTGTNPYITGVPSGDGQEVDLLTGAVRSGAYVVEVADVATGTDSTGTIRIITNKLEDANFRQQLLSRRAKLECSRDNGTTWEVWTFGYLTSLRQTDAITYAFTVSDSRRLESTHTAFTWWSDTNKTTDERREFPNRGCILGGPMIQNFGPLRASGGWEFLWREVQSGYLALAFRAAYEPPSYTRSPYFTVSRWMYDSRNFLQKLPPVTGVTGTNYEQLRDREYVFAYPSLMAMVTVGNDTWYGSVRAAFTPVNYSGSGAGDRTQGFDISRSNYVYIELDPGQSTSYPSANAIARVRILQREVSEVSPIYIDDHPVNIVAKLYSTVGIPYSSTSVTNTKAAVGDDVRLALRVTQPVNMGQFLSDSIFGPFGFSARTNASGEQEFFPTRIANATAPTTSIASADIVGDTPPPVFEVDEATVVTSFKLTSKALVPFVPDPDNSQPPPADGMVQVEASQAVQNADTSTFSTREIAYTFPGMVHDGSASSAAFVLSPEVVTRFFNSIVAEGFDRFGRGAIATEVQVLPTSAAASLQVGDEVVLNIPYYPNKNYRIGESNVGTRIAQIVRRTEAPEGPIFKLIDSGLNQQPSSPTFTVATWSGDPRRVAAVTVTNASTLNSADTTLAVQYQVSSTTPTKTGTLFTRFRPGTIPTGAFLLPIAPPGSRVWVRMRTERAEYRASAWTAWTDVQLDAWVAPTSLATSAATANSITLTWSLAGNTLDPMDVFAYPGSTAPADWTPYRIGTLSAGSTTSIVRDLVASTQYTFGVAFRDSTTGAYSAFTTATASTAAVNTSSCPAAPKMKVITAFENAGSTTGVVLTIGAIEGYNVVVQRAPNVSGSPGTWADIAVLLPLTGYFADILPSDGVTRWYRVFYRLSGFLDGTPGPARSATPIAIPDDLVLNEGPSLISGGSSLTFGSYLTGTPDNFYDGSTAQTLAVDATPNNTNNKVVARDNTGSFSANVVTATLDGAAPAGQLTGNTLAANVTASSLTSVGTIGTGVWQGTSVGKNYGGTGLTSSAFTGITNERVFAYDGVSGSFFVAPSGSNGQALVYSGGALAWGNPAPGSHVLADTTGLGSQHTTSGLTAGMILQATGATTARFQTPSIPASSVTAGTFSGSSYTITNDLTVSGTLTGTLTGNITGNAATVTNGVYTTGTYADPSWITSLAGSKISGNISGSAANVTGTVAIANGGTNATSYGTSGSGTRAIVYDIGSNAFEAVTAGTSGQFLQSAGNAGDITWATPPNFNSTTAGYAPASGGGTSNFLRADGTWAVPSVGSVSANNVTAGTFSGANYYFTNNVRFDSGARVAFGYGYTIDNAGGSPVSVLTATTLGSGVVNSSLTSVGTLTSGALGAGFTAIDNARLANSSIIINGTSVSLGGSITVDTSKWTASGSNIYYSTGNVSIGTTPSSSIELYVRGGGSTSSTYGFLVENSSATSTFWVNDAGNVSIPNGSLSISGNTALHVGNYSSYALPLAGGTLTGVLNTSAASQSLNTTTPGTTTYQLNFIGQSTSDYAHAITWGWATNGAQAGIYVQSSGAYGTKMYLATTDSFAQGAKTAVSIDHSGNVNIARGALTVGGTAVLTSNQTITLSGDVTGSGTTAITTSLANVTTAGTFGGNNAIPRITVDAKGRITGYSTITPSGTWSIDVSGNSATTSQRAFSNDISTTGQGRFTGWYQGNAATGQALEAGVFSGTAYILSYNRSTSSYGALGVDASSINLSAVTGALTFSTNAGTERVRVDTSGNVGIGLTSPSYKLHVRDDIIAVDTTNGANLTGFYARWSSSDVGVRMAYRPNDAMCFIDSTYPRTGGQVWGDIDIRQNVGGTLTSRLYIKNDNGNVGIGTTSPEARLDVDVGAPTNAVGIYLDTDGSGGAAGIGVGSSVGPYLVGNTKPDGTVRGAYGASRMAFNAGGFSFDYSSTTSGARVWTSYAVLNSSGNVGIGTTAPYNRLTIEGSSARMDLNNAGGASRKALLIEPLGYGGNAYARIESYDYGAAAGGILTLNATGGKVGIGETSPVFTLSVAGTIQSIGAGTDTPAGGPASIYLGNGSAGTMLRHTANRGFAIDTYSSASVWGERLRITRDGNVGIGTTAPAYTLDVNGSFALRSTGYVYDTTLYAYRSASGTYLGFTTDANGGKLFMYQGAAPLQIQSDGGNTLISAQTGWAGSRLQVGSTSTSQPAAEFNGTGNTAGLSPVYIWNNVESGSTYFISFYSDGQNNARTLRGYINYRRDNATMNLTTASDYRIKTIHGAYTKSGEVFDKIQVHEGTINGESGKYPMVLAHELQEAYSPAVEGEKDAVNEDGTPKLQMVSYVAMIPVMLAEIKSLRERVAQLERQ